MSEMEIFVSMPVRQDKKSTYTCVVFSSLFIFYLKVKLTLRETSIILDDSPHYSIVMTSTNHHGSYY